MPVDVLAHHLRKVRPGGVLVAVDDDMAGSRTRPEAYFGPDDRQAPGYVVGVAVPTVVGGWGRRPEG